MTVSIAEVLNINDETDNNGKGIYGMNSKKIELILLRNVIETDIAINIFYFIEICIPSIFTQLCT